MPMKIPSDHYCDLLPHAPECLRRGHTKIAPGIYQCSDRDWHVVAPEICRHLHIEPTTENCEWIVGLYIELYGGLDSNMGFKIVA